ATDPPTQRQAALRRHLETRRDFAKAATFVLSPSKSPRGDIKVRSRTKLAAAALLTALACWLTPSSRAQQAAAQSAVLITNARVFDGKSDKLSAATSVL